MTSVELATLMLKIKAVGFVLESPITFKSGLVSPVYVDNRKLPFHPATWKHILNGLIETVRQKNLSVDIVSGVETAGIPHSAVLGYLLDKPSVFVRKAAKDHGTKKMVEGGDITGKKVLLIEDHVTTGSSSLSAVTKLREAGGIVTDCLCITSYEFPEVATNFAAAGVTLHRLIAFADIFSAAQSQQLLSLSEVNIIQDWLNEPHGWVGRQRKLI